MKVDIDSEVAKYLDKNVKVGGVAKITPREIGVSDEDFQEAAARWQFSGAALTFMYEGGIRDQSSHLIRTVRVRRMAWSLG